MKEIAKPLTTGYYSLLNDMVVGGYTVPVYDLKAPWPTTEPYILISGVSTIGNRSANDGFGSDATVAIRVFTAFEGDFGSMDLADLIAAEVLEKVIPSVGVSGVSAAGFNVCGAKLVGSRNSDASIDGKSIYEKILTIEHLIYEL